MPYFSDSVVFSALSDKKKESFDTPRRIANLRCNGLLLTEASVHWLCVTLYKSYFIN